MKTTVGALVVLAGLITVAVSQPAQWYYTGNSRNEKLTQTSFEGSRFDLVKEFFKPEHPASTESDEAPTFLYFGGTAISYVSTNDTIDENTLNFASSQLTGIQFSNISVHYGVYHDVHSIIDYGTNNEQSLYSRLFDVEVGLYHFHNESFTKNYWLKKKFGSVVAIVFDTALATGTDDNEVIHKLEKHWMLVNIDQRSRRSLMFHTWQRYQQQDESQQARPRTEDNKRKLSVMTYNLWHNNPPSWVWRYYKERWPKYDARLRHFSDVIIAEDPDIILLQEVRIDTTFVMESPTKKDGGSQIQHLLWHLRQAQQRKRLLLESSNSVITDSLEMDTMDAWGRSSTRYHVVFQPAMNMINKNQFGHRNEEGIAVLSRYPIIEAEVLLLPRQLDDSGDDHQRAVLRARVQIGDETRSVETDVFTTHLSLSNTAREKAAIEIRKFINRSQAADSSTSRLNVHKTKADNETRHGVEQQQQIEVSLDGTVETPHPRSSKIVDVAPHSHENENCNKPSNLVQILTGDLNAEPHESSIALLHRGRSGAAEGGEGDGDDLILHDTWLAHNEGVESSDGFTFPACTPVKRIDFIFLAQNNNISNDSENNNNSCAGQTILSPTVSRVEVVGKLPSPETMHLVNSREGLGMADLDSPTWASDHFALIADFDIEFPQ